MKRTIDFQSFDRPEFWVGDFVKIAPEIGYVSWAWNALHADLCDLFLGVLRANSPEPFRSIWHAIRSDSGQRDVLLAAAESSVKDKECLAEIRWLVTEVDNLAAIRNDTAHTLWTTIHPDIRNTSINDYFLPRRATPDLERGNPKSHRLKNKNAAAFFNALSGHCMTLIQFARALDIRARGWDESEPLPERPLRPPILLADQDVKSPKNPRRTRANKQRPR